MKGDAISAARTELASVPIFAQMIAGKFGVTVEISSIHRTASTNGKKIFLPALPLPQSPNDVDVALRLSILARGFTVHEVGHVRHTDFSVDMGSGLRPGLMNAIEDPRQEVEMIKEMRGTRIQLDALSASLIGAPGFYSELTPQDDPAWLVSAYVMYRMRGLIRMQHVFDELADRSETAIEQVFGKRVLVGLNGLIASVSPGLRDTKDVAAMADRIIAMLDDEKKLAEQAKKNESEETGDSSDAAGDSAGSASAGDDAEQAGTPSRGDGGDVSDDGATGDSSDGPAGADGTCSPSQGAGSPENAAALAAALEDADHKGLKDAGVLAAKAIGFSEAAIETPAGHIESVLACDVQQYRGNGTMFDPAPVMTVTAQLRAKLRSRLQSIQLIREHEGTRGSVLNQRAIHRTELGDRRLFVTVDDSVTVDTAVYVLLDRSGSMEGERMSIATMAAYALADSLSTISGVTAGVGAFPGHMSILPMGKRARTHLHCFSVNASGLTPLASGITFGVSQLLSVRQSRKILLVVTDGEPDNSVDAAAAISAAERHGIEIAGLGIELEAVRDLFATAGVITQIDQLPTEMFRMLGSLLSSKRTSQ